MIELPFSPATENRLTNMQKLAEREREGTNYKKLGEKTKHERVQFTFF